MSNVTAKLARAETRVRVESPLYHANLPALAAERQQGEVVLREKALLGHLVLRGNADNELFAKTVEKVLGVALPTQPCSSVETDRVLVQWLAPDEWLIIVEGGREGQLEAQLREQLSGHYAITDVSGGQTVLELSGPKAELVVRKSCPYDVHPSNFPTGKCVGTVFAKSTVLLRRTGAESFELVVRRSFADYLWLWLQDASREYGLVISR
ncbi:sarcosine oxidase subunit gamma [Zobellella denitrificans]|jgi:sarcosine oxidase subunit gamma|uniref:Sarcosine oxidase subunit gamma n=1 Tax=Zobellella denitrificans TaxID=347534 RepID=A0A291HQ50_9GAMM|nr:sarcosine oxidase subunit gamma family protein [Zobellella denitrificans]ATG74280.1 sarcosine oxidase subunit gamma [Zobellella denitrificans]